MDLYKLNTFRTVASLLNFNQAAKSLNCAQSTISAQIKSLEDELGVLLFKRIKKRVKLTPAGEKMLGYANKLLSMEEEALADLNGQKDPMGTISLLLPEAMSASWLPLVIKQLLARYPTAGLTISNCAESSLENELQIGSADLAFMFSDYISSSNLVFENIMTQNLVMVAAPFHALAKKELIFASDLEKQTLFFLKTGCGYGLPFRQLLNTNLVKPASTIEITSVAAIKACVMQGLGLTILPKMSVQNELQAKTLVTLNWMEKHSTHVLMAWHKDKRISSVLDYFMDLCRQFKKRI